jgi:hypothetical protein
MGGSAAAIEPGNASVAFLHRPEQRARRPKRQVPAAQGIGPGIRVFDWPGLRPPTIPLEFNVFKRAKDPYYQLKKTAIQGKIRAGIEKVHENLMAFK